MKVAAGIDDDRLAGHRFGAAHGDHHVGAVVLYPSEERYAMIGMVENRLLFVAYAMRGERIRIISARKAEPYAPAL